jgi:hypothetical protein
LPEENATTPARRCELERAHALEVLALEEQLGAEFVVGRARGQHRRAVGLAFQAM